MLYTEHFKDIVGMKLTWQQPVNLTAVKSANTEVLPTIHTVESGAQSSNFNQYIYMESSLQKLVSMGPISFLVFRSHAYTNSKRLFCFFCPNEVRDISPEPITMTQ